MSIALVTGSAGLVGSEAVRYFARRGMEVVGVENDMRKRFFGVEASTEPNGKRLQKDLRRQYSQERMDIRNRALVRRLFRRYGKEIKVVVHAAAQPSHDWAARDPDTDFSVNAGGTQILLEATRRFAPEAGFVFLSTNKVYGDNPNYLPLQERPTRWEIDPSHPFFSGIDESMSIDHTRHSLFGASKVASDILVQEYGKYFGMKTVCFRCGCLTGPQHAGTMLHGFLAYLMKCVATGRAYQIFGYQGKQVRDNIHTSDLVEAIGSFIDAPRSGEVYNMGGGRHSHCSLKEAVAICEGIVSRPLTYEYQAIPRVGDHIWYVSDTRKFQGHYPQWKQRWGIHEILEDIYQTNRSDWKRIG